MKFMLCVSALMAGLLVFTTKAGAATPADGPDGNPDSIKLDQDGVPLSLLHPPARPPTQAQIDAYRRAQEQEALDKNWLLRGYEKQREARAAADTSAGQPDNDYYYQLSLNKNLARLAGIPTLDSTDTDDITSKKTDTDRDPKKSPDGTTDTQKAASTSPLQAYFFKPTFNPLGAQTPLGMNNYFATMFPNAVTPPRAASKRDETRDVDLDTPGMIAAKKDPLLDSTSADLNLDVLPGESIEDAKAHQDNYSKLELPLPMDEDVLHKNQAAALTVPPVPGVPNSTQNAQAIPVAKPAQKDDYDAPQPISKAPVINPVRPPIANPYDILNH